MPETLADDLRRVRVALGLTQEQVAERSGLSVESIKKFEGGAKPNQASLDAIRAALLLDVKPAPALPAGAARNPISSEGSRFWVISSRGNAVGPKGRGWVPRAAQASEGSAKPQVGQSFSAQWKTPEKSGANRRP